MGKHTLKLHRLKDDYTDAEGLTDYAAMWDDLRPPEQDMVESDEPIEYATYDPEDNKLRVYSGRVSEELYARFKSLGFGRAYQQGCFFATWSPVREDIALELCGEIGDEDSTLADRAEARAERFSDYGENAAGRMQSANKASHDAVDGIPFGQPILVGHHSEKRHRAAIKKAQDQATKAVQEWRKSDYWTDRAASVLSHAERKFAPGVTLRRIKKLETHMRKMERALTLTTSDIDWIQSNWLRDNLPPNDDHLYEYERLAQLTDEQRQALNEHVENSHANRAKWAGRWIYHLTGQISFWQAIYDASPKVAADAQAFDLQPGGWVCGRWGWGQIKRVTRRDGRVTSVSLDPSTFAKSWMPRIIKYDEIKNYSTTEPKEIT